jgi:methyl-accepting chemotaxis protein
MANGIREVTSAAHGTAQGAEQVRSASSELSRMSETLRQLVDQFKV